jgi:hypothetical protein
VVGEYTLSKRYTMRNLLHRRGLLTVFSLAAWATGTGGLWFWVVPGDPLGVLPGAMLLGLGVLLATVGLVRARAGWRWRAALDAYAEREIVRARLGRSGQDAGIGQRPWG